MRRIHVTQLTPGSIVLPAAAAHHVRDVLRLRQGAELELFDDAGQRARALLESVTGDGVIATVESIQGAPELRLDWTIASAVPKGSRIDWMIEKLSELGCPRFVPLMTQRSVVHPEGRGKRDRWERIAAEAARQSGRSGTMRIEELTPLPQCVQAILGQTVLCLSTAAGSQPLPRVLEQLPGVAGVPASLTLLIGPEGGWATQERALFDQSGIRPVTLGPTVLRVETAAVAAAVLVSALLAAG